MAGIVPANLRRRMTRLQRGIASGRWSPSHVARGKTELQKLAARRARFVENATIYNPEASLTGNSLRTYVDNLVKGQVDPLKRQAAGVQAAGDKTAGDIESMFRSLAQSQQNAISRQGAISSAASGAVANANQAQQGQLDAAGNAAQTQLGNLINPEYSQSGAAALAKQIAEEKSLASQMGESRAAQTAQQGQAHEAYQNALASSAQLQGTYEVGRTRAATQSRLADILGQIADVEGPGRTKILQDVREQERNYLGERAALNMQSAGLHQKDVDSRRNYRIKARTIKENARHNKITERQAAQQLQINLSKATSENERRFWQNQIDQYKLHHPHATLDKGTSGGGAKGGKPPTKDQTKYKTYGQIIERSVRRGVKDPTIYNPKQLADYINKKVKIKGKDGKRIRIGSVAPILADAVAEKLATGKLSKKTRQLLYDTYGIGGW